MTKEELKLEALKYLENFKDCAKCKHRWGDCADELDEDCLINNCYSATPKEQDIYLAGAEPREKQIQIDAEQIRALQKQNGELTDKVSELEAQIEKMKCCGNCKNEGDYKEPYRYGTGWCNICKRHKVVKGNFDKWEIKENDRK